MRRLFIVVLMGLVWSLASGQGIQTSAGNSSAQPVTSDKNKESSDANNHADTLDNQPQRPVPVFIYGGTFSQYRNGTIVEGAANKDGPSLGDYALVVQAIFAGGTLIFLWFQFCILRRQTEVLAKQMALSEELGRITQRQLDALQRQADVFENLGRIAYKWNERDSCKIPVIIPPGTPPSR